MSEDPAKLSEMLTLFKQGLLVNPKDARKRYQLATVYEKLGREEEAIREYETARKLKNDHFNTREGLGNLYLKLGRLQEGVEVLKEAVSIKSDEPEVQYKLGEAATKIEDFATAADAFLAVTRLEKELLP